MSLTQRDTNILKGIAIIAMLFHHIYACPPEGYGPFGPTLTFLGVLGRCCVAIFLFCSGYGLSVKFSKIDKIGFKTSVNFVTKRLLKFYLNYWFIFLIFVPLGVFAFNIPLTARYGENVNLIKRLFLDFLGLQGFNSYNITWWFNKLIILLYIAFPILYISIKRFNWWVLIASVMISRLSWMFLSPINYYDLLFWQFPFVMGIIWQNNENSFESVSRWIGVHRISATGLAIVALTLAILCRMYHIIPHYSGQHLDPYIAILFALLTVVVINKTKLSTALAFLGHHSANIYLTHTFIGGYWFSELLYHKLNLWEGASIVIIEMSICVIISLLAERIKQVSKYDALSNKIIKLI